MQFNTRPHNQTQSLSSFHHTQKHIHRDPYDYDINKRISINTF